MKQQQISRRTVLLGEHLASMRRRKGVSMAAMAQRIEFGRSSVGDWERGARDLSVSALTDLLTFLDASPEEWRHASELRGKPLPGAGLVKIEATKSLSSLGDALRSLRCRTGLNQTEFGRRLEVNQELVSKWEKGYSEPSLEMRERLRDVLDLTPEEHEILLAGRADTPPIWLTVSEAKSPPSYEELFPRFVHERHGLLTLLLLGPILQRRTALDPRWHDLNLSVAQMSADLLMKSENNDALAEYTRRRAPEFKEWSKADHRAGALQLMQVVGERRTKPRANPARVDQLLRWQGELAPRLQSWCLYLAARVALDSGQPEKAVELTMESTQTVAELESLSVSAGIIVDNFVSAGRPDLALLFNERHWDRHWRETPEGDVEAVSLIAGTARAHVAVRDQREADKLVRLGEERLRAWSSAGNASLSSRVRSELEGVKAVL